MTVIDHVAYPHIIDAILAYSAHTVRLVLRTLSHGFRDKVDALNHYLSWDGQLRSKDGVVVLSLPADHKCNEHPQTVYAPLRFTKILDIHSKLPPCLHAYSKEEGITFDIVRVDSMTDSKALKVPMARTIVCVGHVHLQERKKFDTLVFHAENLWYASDNRPDVPATVRRVVFICPQSVAASYVDYARDIRNLLLCISRVDYFTVVGLPPDSYHNPPCDPNPCQKPRRLLDRLVEIMRDDDNGDGYHQHGNGLVDYCIDWSFLTREEYLATLSKEEREYIMPQVCTAPTVGVGC